MLPTSLAVNPSSSTDARSGAQSGIGSQSFYFGPNPNLAAVLGGQSFSASTLVILALIGGAVFWLVRKKRP